MDTVIYIRWSSAEQSQGNSLERQRDECRRHAATKGWSVVGEIIDDGVSAFRGANTAGGKLGQFIDDVEDGAYPQGVILLVERLDRLSRQEAKTVFVWLMRITELGIVVCTVDGDRRYDDENIDMAQIIEIVVKAQLSNEESAKKSERLRAAWSAKRRKVESGEELVMTRRAPAWLAVEGKPGRFVVIDERAAIVRRIFEETAAGFGKHHIAKELNVEGVATFGRAAAWHASYVQKILASPSVIGEFTPGRKARGEARTAAGEAIEGYYPAIVDADLHARALASMVSRSRGSMGRGRRMNNLFGGLAKCECGTRMTFRSKGAKIRANGDRVHEDYLVCDGYQRGTGCRNGTHYNYGIVERCVLDAVLVQAVDDRHFAEPSRSRKVEIELASRVAHLARTRERAANALIMTAESPRPEPREFYTALMNEVDTEEAAISALRETLIEARGTVSPAIHAKRIKGLREAIHSADEDERFAARVKVGGAIHELITGMEFHRRTRLVGLTLVGAEYVVIHPFGDGIVAGFIADRG